MPGKMTKEEAYAYLDSRPGMMVLTTIGRDGFPHSVPLGYFRLAEDVYLGGRNSTQRVKNVQRGNTKVAVLLDSGSALKDLKGLLIQGDAELITDAQETLRLMREGARWRGTPVEQWPKEARPDVAYIKVKPRRFISWDYSKES